MALNEDQLQSPGLRAEQAVIGSMLIDADCVPQVLANVDPAAFELDADRKLFAGARMLYTAGKGVDALTIIDAIGANDDQDMRRYASELMEVTPTSANVGEYIEIMHEQAKLRAIRAAAAVLKEAGSLHDCDKPMQELSEVYANGQQIEAKTLEEMLYEFARRKGDEAPREYLPLGIRQIDENTYLEHGDVMVIGGAPSDGKTAFALTVAYHLAQWYNVGFYSLETKYDKLEDRLVASGFQIDFNSIKKSQMTDEDWMRFAEGMSEAAKRRLTVLHASGLTAEQITASARARGFDIIFVDYVQLIRPLNTRNVPRHEQIAEISQTLHTFAQSTNTLVVELAQLGRKERQSKRERDMFDLGESSQLEKDADIVLLLYRPEKGTHFIEGDKSSETLDPDKTRILRIAKQKEGMRVRLPLVFDGAHQSFAVMGEDPHAAIRRASRDAQKKSVVEGGVQEFISLPKSEEEGMPF